MERTTLPNSTASLVLGILSIITGVCCYGILGVILGIIAIILGKKAQNIYNTEPEIYSGIGNATAGFVTGIIGVILSLVFIAFLIWLFSTIGWDAMQDPDLMQERLNKLF